MSLVDARGNNFVREGKIIGFDPAFDLAVLKVYTMISQFLHTETGSRVSDGDNVLTDRSNNTHFPLSGIPSLQATISQNYFSHVQVDVDGHEIKPAVLGISKDIHVGQSCFAIGNPYGYENTLTTGVIFMKHFIYYLKGYCMLK